MLPSRGSCFARTLFVGNAVDHLDYGGDVMVREAVLDAPLVEADGHVEQRCSGSRLVGHVTDIIEIMREHFESALRRQEVFLDHAGCTDGEQYRTATATGNRLDHHVGIEAGFETECDGLADRRGVHSDQQIVYEFDFAGPLDEFGIGVIPVGIVPVDDISVDDISDGVFVVDVIFVGICVGGVLFDLTFLKDVKNVVFIEFVSTNTYFFITNSKNNS